MSLFRKEVYESRAKSAFGDVRVASPFGHILITVILFFITLSIIVAALIIDYSETVKVDGYLIPEKGLVNIVSDQQGVVKFTEVMTGSTVRSGETLFEIETNQSLASGDTKSEKLNKQLIAKKSNLLNRISIIENENISSTELTLQNIRELENEVQRLEESIALQERIVSNEKNIFESFSRLKSRESASFLELSNAENRFLQSSQNLSNLYNEIAVKKGAIMELRLKLKLHKNEKEKAVNQVESELLDIDRTVTEITAQDGYIIKAPVDGIITNTLVSLGTSVNQSENLASLLPKNSPLLAQLLVPSRGIGRIELGQKVKLFYDAFPYQKFGYFNGTITEISRSIVSPSDLNYGEGLNEPVFLVLVELDNQSIIAENKEIRLQPGMKLSANVVLRRQKVINFILGPIFTFEKA